MDLNATLTTNTVAPLQSLLLIERLKSDHMLNFRVPLYMLNNGITSLWQKYITILSVIASALQLRPGEVRQDNYETTHIILNCASD